MLNLRLTATMLVVEHVVIRFITTGRSIILVLLNEVSACNDEKKTTSSDAGRPTKILPKVDRWCSHFTSNQVALVLFSQMEDVSVSPDNQF